MRMILLLSFTILGQLRKRKAMTPQKQLNENRWFSFWTRLK